MSNQNPQFRNTIAANAKCNALGIKELKVWPSKNKEGVFVFAIGENFKGYCSKSCKELIDDKTSTIDDFVVTEAFHTANAMAGKDPWVPMLMPVRHGTSVYDTEPCRVFKAHK